MMFVKSNMQKNEAHALLKESGTIQSSLVNYSVISTDEQSLSNSLNLVHWVVFFFHFLDYLSTLNVFAMRLRRPMNKDVELRQDDVALKNMLYCILTYSTKRASDTIYG